MGIFRFLPFVVCTVLLRSLMKFRDIGPRLCINPVSHMAAANNVSVDTDSVLRSPPLYSVDEYIRSWSGRLDIRRSPILSAEPTLMVTIAHSERETAYAG